jgi:methyltransferase
MRACYLALLGLIALQRLAETRRSRRNEAGLRRRGAVEHGSGHFPLMVALHTLWLISCALEAWFLVQSAPQPLLMGLAVIALLAGQALRILAIHSLGERWTVRVLVLPDSALVESGIFRRFRHPNYIGVCLEIAALPLIFGCWRTAIFFSLANAALLRHRIAVEEAALGG